MTLVQHILAETDIPRLRLSSLEPWDIAPDFFELWEDARLCPHLHLPLQSGCDATLRRMRRNTSQTAFRQLVESARATVPGISITTDVIVGFPGEDDAEFAESRAFIEAMDFAGLHVFPYSRRPGTPAARMKHQVRKATRKARVAELLAVSQGLEQAYAARFIGMDRQVLWEQVTGATQDGFINVGYTDNYIRVRCIHPRPLANHITAARLDAYDGSLQQMQTTALIDSYAGEV